MSIIGSIRRATKGAAEKGDNMSKSYTIGRMENDGRWYFITTHSKEYAKETYNKWLKNYIAVSGKPE